MKTHLYPIVNFLTVCAVLWLTTISSQASAQATYAVPVSIGNSPCTDVSGFGQFNYVSQNLTLTQLNPTSCNLGNLAYPSFNEFNASIAFNPADTSLYYTRYIASDNATYVWRWTPGQACPPATAVLRVYPNVNIMGITFDANGLGYQLITSGSSSGSGYNLALQSVDFKTGTLGPVTPISLPSGRNPLQGNGDFVITPTGQFLAILENNYFSINYQDYGTAPLKATLISKIPGNTIIGLSYSDGKLVASDYYSTNGKYRSNYYEVNIITGARTTITTAPCYFSTDMTDINTAIGAAKRLSSAIPTGVDGQYDICYDIYVQNYGNWPLSNVTLTEDLSGVFGGNSNISNVSATLIDNPAGVTLNPAYNGKTGPGGVRQLLATGSRLPAAPLSKNHFTVRVCVRVSNIVIGRVYNNNATAYGQGYMGIRVTDVSTNGSNPDLNNNGKPDDTGEDVPTPFVISVAAEMPPCDALNRILFKQDFGTGTTVQTAIPAATGSTGTASTDYTGNTIDPLPVETYAITRTANAANSSQWINNTDHTGNSNGRMMVVNADVRNNIIYKDRVAVPCANLKYSLFAFVSNIANSSYEDFCTDAFGRVVYPKLNFIVRDLTGLIITNITTPEITSADWTQFGMKFVMPAGITSVDIEIRNLGAGGCGNDLAIDDIQFGLCDPIPTVSVNATAGCTSNTTTFSAALSDPTVISGALAYRWEVSTNGTSWTTISGANNVTYTINPLQTSNTNKYYRVIVAAAGQLDNTSCRYVSNAFLLTAKTSSSAPSKANASPTTTCAGNPVILSVQGGSLGTNASWNWYSGSCGGTRVGTGSSITVTPSATTTYFVRAEGDCNTTNCASVTVTVNTCTVLPIEFQQFGAQLQNKAVDLNWRIVTSEQVDHFEIERSLDGASFSKLGIVYSTVAANISASFSYKDGSIDVNEPVYYYRIKVVSKGGLNKYSNILVVRFDNNNTEKMKLSPNPAATAVNISFNAASRGIVEYQVMDMTGKIVVKAQHRAEQGANVITVNGLGQFSEGVYTVMLRQGDKLEYERLVIKR